MRRTSGTSGCRNQLQGWVLESPCIIRTAIVGREEVDGVDPDVVLGQGEMHKCGELFAGSVRRIGSFPFALKVPLQSSRLLNKCRAGYGWTSSHVIGP